MSGKNAGVPAFTATSAFTPDPARGRVYPARRIVRSTDVTPAGRLRLDALARYLQTAAEDDLADSGLLSAAVWLVRRCSIVAASFPRMGERVVLHTFCSGTGLRWAERTTTLAGADGPMLQSTAVWAAVSPADGRPVAPGEAFLDIYGESAGGRVVSARLGHGRPPAGPEAGRPWPLRASDFDTAGHVNNAVAWAAVEDVIAETGCAPGWAEVEYPRAILPGCEPHLVSEGSAGEQKMWLVSGGRVLASAVLGASKTQGSIMQT
jgi:acyl-ACP thioesterase